MVLLKTQLANSTAATSQQLSSKRYDSQRKHFIYKCSSYPKFGSEVPKMPICTRFRFSRAETEMHWYVAVFGIETNNEFSVIRIFNVGANIYV